MQFRHPPILHNVQGSIRTVGFELEFSNVDIATCVQLIRELYGGSVEEENRFKQHVKDTRLGNFTVEFDLTLLTEKRYKKVFETFNIHVEEVKLGEGTLEDEVETLLESMVAKVFPYEIACPPVPLTQLQELEKLREALHLQHAEGTESFPTNAFGTHINIEAPSLETEVILNYIRALLLLYPWLLEAGKTNLARRLSPFIDPFPVEYALLILDPAYAPSQPELIEDYHTYNPDRNRPLDMYPLFAALQEQLVAQFTGLGKVKPRKAFHYRLPNSSIALPGWTLAQEWNNWVTLEELACNKEKLEHLSQDYLLLKKDTLLGFDAKWLKKLTEWLP